MSVPTTNITRPRFRFGPRLEAPPKDASAMRRVPYALLKSLWTILRFLAPVRLIAWLLTILVTIGIIGAPALAGLFFSYQYAAANGLTGGPLRADAHPIPFLILAAGVLLSFAWALSFLSEMTDS